MAQPSRGWTVIEQQGRIRDTKCCAGEFFGQEWIVKGACIVEMKEAESHLIDQRGTEDVLIGDSKRSILIGTAQGKWRSQAGRVGERIERGKVARKENAAQRIVLA